MIISKNGKNLRNAWSLRRFFLKLDNEKMAEMMCLSEHPFGTIKRTMEFSYFLLGHL
jgi:hypothetical protein